MGKTLNVFESNAFSFGGWELVYQRKACNISVWACWFLELLLTHFCLDFFSFYFILFVDLCIHLFLPCGTCGWKKKLLRQLVQALNQLFDSHFLCCVSYHHHQQAPIHMLTRGDRRGGITVPLSCSFKINVFGCMHYVYLNALLGLIFKRMRSKSTVLSSDIQIIWALQC